MCNNQNQRKCATSYDAWEYLNRDFANIKSLSLRLNKLLYIGGNSKADEINAIARKSEIPCDETLLKEYHKSLDSIPNSQRFDCVLASRMMVDMAGGVLENSGLCIHPHFNVPMIPGSALKGLAGHQIWVNWSNANSPEEKKKLAETAARIFGFPTNNDDIDGMLKKNGYDEDKPLAGTISFLPALPPAGKTWELEADILTPHPHTEGNPIPNAFITVAAGAKFTFRLIKTNRGNDDDFSLAVQLLQEAIYEHGVGAKTAAGYGWFEKTKSNAELANDDIDKIKTRMSDLQEIIDSVSSMCLEAQKFYVQCMKKRNESSHILRKWKNKGNPKLEQIMKIARNCGEDLQI